MKKMTKTKEYISDCITAGSTQKALDDYVNYLFEIDIIGIDELENLLSHIEAQFRERQATVL